MRILVTGQCSVHWGRLEFGNIGNYYITESTFRELHRVFPDAEIVTTFQMTDEFCEQEDVKCLPMELFYSWSGDDVDNALKELAIAELYNKTGKIVKKTPYIRELLKTDLLIDFSGELWGEHAEPVGSDRFLVGLIKNRVAQLFNIKTALLAGSQGPFKNDITLLLAKEVFANFSIVSNREPASVLLLDEYGFDTNRVKSYTDAAFLFNGTPAKEMEATFNELGLINKEKPVVGYILCGFNMLEGPYDKWPRREDEFVTFVESIEYIINILGAKVVLMSHQNGFELPPAFQLINGRDYPYAKALFDIVLKRGNVKKNDIFCINKPYLPKQTKTIIGQFDMLVTGRIHGFVAAVSQKVPAVIINRGNSPKSLRNIGFARSVGMDKYLASPDDKEELINLIDECFRKRSKLKNELIIKLPEVIQSAKRMYESLLTLF